MNPVRFRWRRDRAGALAEFVPREIARLMPSALRALLPAPEDGDPLVRLEAVFTALAQAGIKYGNEPTTSEPGRQVIRPAREILAGPRNGTCLDLAVLFSGACLDAGLHPAVVVLDPAQPGDPPHAIALVWTGGGWPGRPDPGYPGLDADPDDDPASTADDLTALTRLPPGLLARVKSVVDGPGDLVAVDSAWIAAGAPGAPAGGNPSDLWTGAVRRGGELLRSPAWRWAVGVDIGCGFDPREVHPTPAPPRVDPLIPPYHEASRSQSGDGEGPLTQLRPRSRTVPFCARDELDALLDWFEPDPETAHENLRVSLVHGVGGCGKTRLAAELCYRLARDGWYAGFARRHPPQDVLDYLADVAQPLLVVVDYPEGVTEDDLAGLLRALAARQEPTGVLLTARRPGTETGQWWDTFTKRAAEENITFAGPLLIPLGEQHPSPAAVFRRARAEFIRRARHPPAQPPPAASGETALPAAPRVGGWTTLDVVMLAWLSATETCFAAPLSRNDLYEAIWAHELEHWQRTYRRRRGEDLRPGAARAAAAAVTALQPPRDHVTQVLRQLPEFRNEAKWAGDVAEALAWLLPDDGEAGIAIRPDPIGDHLLISALNREPGFLLSLLRGLEPSQAPGLAAPAPAPYSSTDEARLTACAVLSRASQWHEDDAGRAAAQLLQDMPSLWRPALAIALRVGGPFALALRQQAERQFGTRASNAPDTDATLPWQLLSDYIPVGHSALSELALIASRALLRLAPSGDDQMASAQRASSLNNLGTRLWGARPAGRGAGPCPGSGQLVPGAGPGQPGLLHP